MGRNHILIIAMFFFLSAGNLIANENFTEKNFKRTQQDIQIINDLKTPPIDQRNTQSEVSNLYDHVLKLARIDSSHFSEYMSLAKRLEPQLIESSKKKNRKS